MSQRLLILLLALSIGLCDFASAQGGYRDIEIEQVGLEYRCARDFETIPTSPGEEWILRQYVEELPRRDRDRRAFRPSLQLVWIPWTPGGGPITGEGSTPGDEGEGEGEGDGEGEGRGGNRNRNRSNSIHDHEDWLERYMRGWSLNEGEEDRERDGFEGSEHELEREKGGGPTRRWAYVHQKLRTATLLWVGECHADDWDEMVRIWRTMARSARFSEPEEQDMSRWEAFYENRPQYINPSYRLQVRSQLVRGWEADDTENYIFVYSTPDQKLLSIVKRELEAIREVYVDLFPPAAPVRAVSTVRICKDQAEYHAYGGPPGSGGYWNSAEEELVFYDYENVDGEAGTGRANSRIVLYHEAFHQYIYYSVGELAPHSWYNEGTGDFFSGAVMNGGRVRRIGVNPWRIRTIKSAVEQGAHVSWADIVGFSQAQYYRNAGLCYAQGWSMIYFLRTSREVERREDWARILPTYFDTLKAEYARLTGESGGGELSRSRKNAIGEEAREAALEAAFDGVDFDEIEQAWIEFVNDLREPR